MMTLHVSIGQGSLCIGCTVLGSYNQLMKTLYSILCLLGIALPLSQLMPWLAQHGFDIPLLIDEAFGNRISAFAWLDVVVSAIVVLAFVLWEGQRIGMRKLWIPIAGLFSVGVSLGLPLFLLLREMHLDASNSHH